MRHRSDNTQKPIIDIIESYGGFVVNLNQVGDGCPDVLVHLFGWHLLEIKTGGPVGWKFTPAQKDFRGRCPVAIPVLQSEEDAHTWCRNVRRGTKVKAVGEVKA